MAQHDLNIANQGFPAFRADLNNALGALVSNSSGATAPATTFAHQFWVDTSANPSVLKIRNADNDAFITIGEIDQTGDKFNLKCANATILENLTVNAQGDVRFADSDSSHFIAFQAPATVTSNVTFTLPAADGTSGQALTTNGSGVLSFAAGSPDGGFGFRNRIINGDMVIDQRNAGAAVTGIGGTPGIYTLDRFRNSFTATTARYSIQQVVDAPGGFYNSLKVTITTDESPLAAGSASSISQFIEGFNCYDIKTSGAQKPIAFSFMVKSSKTGTFIVELADPINIRAVSASYTIDSANTWEYKTIPFPADTSATWAASNSATLLVSFGLFAGSNLTSGTLQTTWAATTNANRFVGQSNLADTNGATFFITGVQLEVGSVATPFERRPFGAELALCQRYLEKSMDTNVAFTSANAAAGALGVYTTSGSAGGLTTAQLDGHVPFRVEKRTNSTFTVFDAAGNAGVCARVNPGVLATNNQLLGFASIGTSGFGVGSTGGVNAGRITFHWMASAEL